MTFITYFITFDGLFLKVPKHYHLNFRLAKKRLILNEEIRAERVRLLDERGEQIGIVTLSIALEKAREKGLELALVATHPENPVCKFMDYGKYQYEQKKQQRKLPRQTPSLRLMIILSPKNHPPTFKQNHRPSLTAVLNLLKK